jgi:hypothetical protein
MIHLCSCGFATDDAEWLEDHLFEYPGHHERPPPRLPVAAPMILADLAQRVEEHPRLPCRRPGVFACRAPDLGRATSVLARSMPRWTDRR